MRKYSDFLIVIQNQQRLKDVICITVRKRGAAASCEREKDTI